MLKSISHRLLFFYVLLIILVLSGAISCSPQVIENWSRRGTDTTKYEMTIANITHKNNKVLYIGSVKEAKEDFGTLMRYIENVEDYKGKKIKISGYIKTKNVTNKAGFWLRMDGKEGQSPLNFDNMDNKPIVGTSDWNKYEIVLNVPKETKKIAYGCMLQGEGEVWFDEKISIEIVGNDTPETNIAQLKLVTQKMLDNTRNLNKGNINLNATYLTLNHIFENSNNVEWIYAEVKVPKNEAPLKTYYCVIGGDLFYSGIQTISATERRIIFSVWDVAGGNNNPDSVKESSRAKLLYAKRDLIHNRFGNEGSGVHTHYIYDWKEDSTYKFLLHANPDSLENNTTFTLFVNLNNEWTKIAKISTPINLGYPKYAYSFLEDFSQKDDLHRRSASYQNVWARQKDSKWVEFTKAYYYLSFGDNNRWLKDYGCGLSETNGFMLSSGGGFTYSYIPPAVAVRRPPNGQIPVKLLPEIN